ncbi:MAG: SDR family NAD(P)-dependent oxidoreductase [Bacteroidia bacterium]|nr:SDR family NAD(P)-dependent oxidoreductase [Bacteroidia bacterium]
MKRSFKERFGTTALVAGASEGIGFAFAELLASHGLNVVMIGRRERTLADAASRLRDSYPAGITTLVCDLSTDDAARQIADATCSMQVDVLVYNAAMAHIGPHLALSHEAHAQMVNTNVVAPLALCNHYGAPMVQRGRGAIVLMSSLAGFQGAGYLSLYGATKAFSRVLAEGLWYEWRTKGVSVMACCAGATDTPNYARSKPGKLGWLAPRIQQPHEVAHECLEKLGSVPCLVTGGGNRWASFVMTKLFSRKRATIIMGNATRNLYNIRD